MKIEIAVSFAWYAPGDERGASLDAGAPLKISRFAERNFNVIIRPASKAAAISYLPSGEEGGGRLRRCRGRPISSSENRGHERPGRKVGRGVPPVAGVPPAPERQVAVPSLLIIVIIISVRS